MVPRFQLRSLVVSALILPSLASLPSLGSRALPLTDPQNSLTIDTPFPTDFPAVAATSNVTLPPPATDGNLLNASYPVPDSRLSITTSYATASPHAEDSYALLSWLQYKCLRFIVDNGSDGQAPIRYTQGPAPTSGRTFTYTINEYVVGSEMLRLSDVATVCAGLVMLLRHLEVSVLAFDVARDGGSSPVMTGILTNTYRGGADDVAVD